LNNKHNCPDYFADCGAAGGYRTYDLSLTKGAAPAK
jgi:hypothetical protein